MLCLSEFTLGSSAWNMLFVIYGCGCGFFISPLLHSQQSTKSVGDNNLYAFATIGQASHDANLDSAVSSGSLSLTRSADDEGTAVTLGVGLQPSDKIAFEFYGGTIDGFGSTTTLTATNAMS